MESVGLTKQNNVLSSSEANMLDNWIILPVKKLDGLRDTYQCSWKEIKEMREEILPNVSDDVIECIDESAPNGNKNLLLSSYLFGESPIVKNSINFYDTRNNPLPYKNLPASIQNDFRYLRNRPIIALIAGKNNFELYLEKPKRIISNSICKPGTFLTSIPLYKDTNHIKLIGKSFFNVSSGARNIFLSSGEFDYSKKFELLLDIIRLDHSGSAKNIYDHFHLFKQISLCCQLDQLHPWKSHMIFFPQEWAY